MILTRLMQRVPDTALLNGITFPAGAQLSDAAGICADVNGKVRHGVLRACCERLRHVPFGYGLGVCQLLLPRLPCG